MKIFLKNSVILLITSTFLYSCGKNYSPEQKKYIETIEAHRAHKDSLFEFAVNSPFNMKEKVEFEPLNYYDIDPNFVFESKLNFYEDQDTLTVYGTKGEARKTVRFGYLTFSYNDKEYILNVYKSFGNNDQFYYGIWFTDKTTNGETYGVGRYLDFELKNNPDFIYTIDFNLAYNPYCAYSSAYSCAIPTKEDYLDLAIEAGEKKFHD